MYKATKTTAINSSGFTMIESLLSLYIQLLILTLLPILIMTLIHFRAAFLDDQTYPHELMAREIGLTLHHSDVSNVNISQNQLEIKQGHTTYTYHIQNLKLVKQVNGRGNITVLNQVKKAQYSKIGKHNLKVTITFWGGDTWIEKAFII